MISDERLSKLQEYKYPPVPSNCLGLEFEFISQIGLTDFCELVSNSPIEKFSQVKKDGSLRPTMNYPYGLELVCCISEKKYITFIPEIIQTIKQAKSTVNKSCGFHVHIDMRNRDYKSVYNNFYRCQAVLFAMNPMNRFEGNGVGDGGGFAKKSKYNTTRDAMLAESMPNMKARYKGINIASVGRHNTLEIRIHSGTLNFEKVNNWLQIILAIANYDDLILHNIISPCVFCTCFGLDDEMFQYIDKRINRFCNQKLIEEEE